MSDFPPDGTNSRRRVASSLALTGLVALAVLLLVVRTRPNEVKATTGSSHRDAEDGPSRTRCVQLFAARGFDRDLELARDPFRAETTVPERAPQHESAARDEVEREARGVIEVGAVMLGPTPRALINGHVYEVGQLVHGFHIRRIEQRRVVVERDGVTIVFEL